MTRTISALLLPMAISIGCNRASAPNPSRQPEQSANTLTIDTPKLPVETKRLTSVPQLAGVPGDWAMQLLRLKQLRGVGGHLYLPADQFEAGWVEGRVYLQSPRPSTVTRCDAHVAFWTAHRAAKDDAMVEVPSVIGKRIDAATAELEKAGFTVMTVYRQPAKDESNETEAVLDQYPRSTQILGISSTVLLHVASSSN